MTQQQIERRYPAGTGRSRFCGGCRKTSEDQKPAGWLQYSLIDPDTSSGYRWLGLYCSTECLAAQLPEVARLLARIDELTARIDELTAELAQFAAVVPAEPDDETRWLGTDGATYERHDSWRASGGERRWYNTNSGGPETWAEVWKQGRPTQQLVTAPTHLTDPGGTW